MDIFEVELSDQAKEQLISMPLHIAFKLQSWITGVQTHGLREMKKVLGYDEPLKGNRKGQRSIRLNKAYRAFYIINKNGIAEFIEVIEVNKHEY